MRVHGAGSTLRDVTPICYYNSSNPEIAEVDADGYVRFKTRGEVAIIAHYLNLVARTSGSPISLKSRALFRLKCRRTT